MKVLETQRRTDEIGLDYSTDYYDHLHLNSEGAEKYSAWLGARIAEMFDLTGASNSALDRPWRDEFARYAAQSDKDARRTPEDSSPGSIRSVSRRRSAS